MGREGQMEGKRFPNYTKLQAWVSTLRRGIETAGAGELLFTNRLSYLQIRVGQKDEPNVPQGLILPCSMLHVLSETLSCGAMDHHLLTGKEGIPAS